MEMDYYILFINFCFILENFFLVMILLLWSLVRFLSLFIMEVGLFVFGVGVVVGVGFVCGFGLVVVVLFVVLVWFFFVFYF